MSLGRRLGWALISAALLALGWTTSYVFAWLAPMALLWALAQAPARHLLYVGLVVGVGHSAVLTGLAGAGGVVYLAVALSYGLALVLFCGLQAVLTAPSPMLVRPWLSGAAWVVVEWLHAQVPYAAPNHLGDTQSGGPLLPLARIGGTYAVGFAMVVAGGAIIQGLRAPRSRRSWIGLGCVAVAGVAASIWAMQAVPEALPRPMSVASIQGGIPTWAYARAEKPGPWAQVPARIYSDLTRLAPRSELTVWPETAVWKIWGESRAYEEHLRGLRAARGGALLVGLPRRDAAQSYANAAVLLTARGMPQFTDKRRLALLAEVSFSPGSAPGVLRMPRDESGEEAALGVVFCLETVTPAYVRDVVRGGAQVVIALAEGGRFGNSEVGRIHADHSVIRAVEAGRTLLHAGQHGFTSVIDARGVRTEALPAFSAEILTADLTLHTGDTPYVRWGDWVVALAVAVASMALANAAWAGWRRRRANENSAT